MCFKVPFWWKGKKYFQWMIDENIIPEDILLHDEDFPRNYVNMKHPEDYIVSPTPMDATFVISSRQGRHHRLIARIAWQTENGNFIPMSFVCDTGAPSSFYLSPEARNILEEHKVLRIHDEMGEPFVKARRRHGDFESTYFMARIDDTPQIHKNANILGLKVLLKIGLHLNESGFSFDPHFRHF